MAKRRPNRTRTIQGAKDKQMRSLSDDPARYSYHKDGEVYEMTQHERCGGGRRVIRKNLGGGNY